MKLRTIIPPIALSIGVAMSAGCTDLSRDLAQARAELQPLFERAIELQERIATAGEITDADRRDVLALSSEISAWNARYEVGDVVMGGRNLEAKEPEVFASRNLDPIIHDPSNGCDGWKCIESYSERTWIFLVVCYLIKSICYTDGSLDCEYDCLYFPLSMVQPA